MRRVGTSIATRLLVASPGAEYRTRVLCSISLGDPKVQLPNEVVRPSCPGPPVPGRCGDDRRRTDDEACRRRCMRAPPAFRLLLPLHRDAGLPGPPRDRAPDRLARGATICLDWWADRCAARERSRACFCATKKSRDRKTFTGRGRKEPAEPNRAASPNREAVPRAGRRPSAQTAARIAGMSAAPNRGRERASIQSG